MSETIAIEVCYACANRQTLLALKLAQGTTVREAIQASGICDHHPEIDLITQKVGIFGRLVPLDMTLSEHDRVEIYRPLRIDPKFARQQRVSQARQDGSLEGRKWRRRKKSA